MPKTSSKSVSKTDPKKKLSAKPKRATTTTKKPAIVKKRTTTAVTTTKKKKVSEKKQGAAKKKIATKRPSSRTKPAKVAKKPTKAVAPASKVVKKVAVKKTTKKLTATRPVKGAAANQTTTKKPDIVLPTRMSIRAREKALVLAEAFEKDFYVAGLTLAKVGGFCFILLGSLATYSQLSLEPMFSNDCSTGSCNAALVGDAVDFAATTVQKRNYVELLADVPDIIEVKVGIPIQFSTANKVRAYVRYLSATGASETRVALEPIGNNKYEAYIDPEILDPNQYELMVSVLHTNNSSPTVYSLGFFAILEDEEDTEEDTEQETVDQKEVEINVTADDKLPGRTETPIDSSAQSVGTSTAELSIKPAATTETQTKDISQTVSKIDEPVIAKDVLPVEIETKQPENIEVEPVKLEPSVRISADKELRGIAEVVVENAKRGEIVTFYIRPVQTLNTQSVGQLIPGVRAFRFNTKSFPNGQYQLYAERKQNQAVDSSNAIAFTINNVTAPVSSVVTPAATGTERQLFNVTNDLQASAQQLTDGAGTTTNPVINIQDRARIVLGANPKLLQDLFQRYAVAEQSGDQTLITEAKQAIQSHREQVLYTALNDESNRLLAKELETSLGEELDALMQKVRTFEMIRKDRTDLDSAIDTDGDGISDFDEVNLYKTNPALADSDNDGFTDGAEIISGFDPNDSAVEAAITYQSPKESVGVVTTKKLRVAEVVPEVELSANNVRTVVRGVGLPNSFVTLFLYSTPTIVTVQTEADGSFEYTFSKELEDGQHEVFVAITDNTGSIVAQSEAFTFIKQAQAFTPVDAESQSGTIAAPDLVTQTSPYRTALGMSVLALGILLLLLGVGLRSHKPDVVILEDRPV